MKKSGDNNEKIILLFVLFDILYAPYISILATTYSQLLVFVWFILKNKRVFPKNEILIYYWISLFVAISVFISFFTLPKNHVSEYMVENAKIGLNIVMGISYYFFFTYYLRIQKIRLERWAFLFLVYVALWGGLYYINFSLYVWMKGVFNAHDGMLMELSQRSFFYRYGFIWADPNNIGYATVGVASFLIVNKRVSDAVIFISLLLLSYVLFLSMSAGSIMTAGIIIPLALLYRLKSGKTLVIRLMTIIIITGSIYVISAFSDKLLDSDVGQGAVSRFEEKTREDEPRLKIWSRLIEEKNIFYYVFAGEGSSIFVNGYKYKPHSGHLFFIFGYGIICYYIYMFMVFRKSKRQEWSDMLYILPFLSCFTINIGVGEVKYVAIMYMLVAYSRVRQKDNQEPV